MKSLNGSAKYLVASILLVISLLAACKPVTPDATTAPASAQTVTPIDQATFRVTMRMLWEDHISWTRLYIVSIAAGLPDSDANAQRLLQNQVDIGNAIKPFYGEDAGNQLTTLLKDHILGAADLLTAVKAGDNAQAEAATEKWYSNADEIAAFLGDANPQNWPLADMKAEMKMHLDLTLEEASAHLNGDTAADIAAYDKVKAHILGFADVLSAGVISQFPDKFAPDSTSVAQLELRNAMRQLWEDHVFWTRLYIVSLAADLPDLELTAQRLLQNQTDIGDAIKPVYGDEVGNQLTALLEDHILGAADLLAAAKAGDSAKVEDAKAKWYANADDIATFLSGANPDFWPLVDMQAGMKMHLDLTLEEATAHLNQDTAADIANYDKVHQHIVGLADLLSAGIIRQFPDKFN